ncbi:MAG: FAD-binding protein [Candidatus Onthomonas sp.]
MVQTTLKLNGHTLPVYALDVLIVGSGCAGFNAADWLYDLGRRDIAILTEGVKQGTSRNTGSDKQTYYKLSLASDGPDSVAEMAETLASGGSVHRDTARIEAACSARCFIKLANLGVPFPTNAYGEYVGYKTDHDPRQRATSAGPLTSRLMTEALEGSVRRKGVRIFDQMMAAYLLVEDGEVFGLAAIDLNRTDKPERGVTLFSAKHIILATGGPAGIYADSVYPLGHTGMSGLALEAGAKMVNLEQWQYGLASVDFRWNVSGTYQQVLPRYISVDENGTEREFLPDYFDSPQEALKAVFLKGYQWPFDVRKVEGSSRIDLIVHHETAVLGRRVYLDFRRNPTGLDAGLSGLSEEAYQYLANSDALLPTPLARLERMNPDAIALYRAHGIDLSREPLRIAVCAQHCNGGIAVDRDWQTSIRGLYAAGEAAGTFGVYRPGGSALNSTQVGSLRAAEHIAYGSDPAPFDEAAFATCAVRTVGPWMERLEGCLERKKGSELRNSLRFDLQCAMSCRASLLREPEEMQALRKQVLAFCTGFWEDFVPDGPDTVKDVLKTWDMLLTQGAVLDAMCRSAETCGSRGAGLVQNASGCEVPSLPELRYAPTAEGYDEKVLYTWLQEETPYSSFEPVRPEPAPQDWFETVWGDYRRRTARVTQNRQAGEKAL